MKENGKLLAISAGLFTVVVLSELAARSIYTNSSLGIDKKVLAMTGGAGIIATFLVLKYWR